MDKDTLLVAAIGVDANGDEHPLGLAGLIDNLVARRLDPTCDRLDGAKALFGAIRRTFGCDAAFQRCQIHETRNIVERLPKSMDACRNVKYLRLPWMALRWAAAAMQEASKGLTSSVPTKHLVKIAARKFQCATNATRISINRGIAP